ncbi:MAG TPA: HK97 family phage prohead protease [Gaiellaceae bacterium]|nr:HK97 family phage prohead protease [Gaiellaceae bacterium]
MPSGRDGHSRALRAAGLDRVEIRETGDKLTFTGHAAVFNRLSDDLGGFKERILPGAFGPVLNTNPDVRFLSLDHGGLPLARTSSGTMELREDPTGLSVVAELAPIQASRDLKVLIQRKDLSQMSFGFSMGDTGQETWTEEDGQLVRTISQFGRLFDVSPVTFPAYQQTDASMRALALAEAKRFPRLAQRRLRLLELQPSLRRSA